VDLVATAEVSVSLTIEADAPLAELTAELGRFARVEASRGSRNRRARRRAA
jgi:hypothetical protein